MGVFDALERRAAKWPPGPTDDFWFRDIPSFTSSGAVVSPDESLSLTTVWRAVDLVAGTIATLPLNTYQRRPDGKGRDLARGHDIFNLLRWQPNRWQTANKFFYMQQAHKMLRGNCFSKIVRDPLGKPTSIVPWNPDRVKIKVRADGDLAYTLQARGREPETVRSEDMWHVTGMTLDGIVGVSPIKIMAESVGAAMASRSYGSKFFGNATRPSGLITHPGKITKEAEQLLLSSWHTAYGGGNMHGAAILQGGMDWKPMAVTNEEAQFIATRRFDVMEIARLFGVPPHLLMEMEQATFSNIEQQSREFVQYSLVAHLVSWQQTAKSVLLPGEDDVFVEFLLAALLRGDTLARAQANEIRFRNGSLSINEIRAMENDNPIEGEGGDAHFVPLNYQTIEDAMEGLPESNDVPPPDDDRSAAYLTRAGANVTELRALQVRSAAGRHRQMLSFRRLFVSASQRVVDREVNQLRRLKFSKASIRSFYKTFPAVVSKLLLPTLRAYGEQVFATASGEIGSDEDFGAGADTFVKDYANNVGLRHSLSSEGQLLALVDEAEDAEAANAAIDKRLDEWTETRAGKMADRESTQANGAMSVFAYVAGGIVLLRWVTVGANCPLCNSLDGKVVGVEENFVDAGDTVKGAGVSPLTARRNVGHAPLHAGCDCLVVAEKK